MKGILFVLAIGLASCDNIDQQNKTPADTLKTNDSSKPIMKKPPELESKTYSNERFRGVTIEKTGDHTFLVQGEGQIFEANFSWVVEDGHEELKKGFQMTDAGAPEWGKFRFTIDAEKKRPNSTLHLILFESSPKDGSRQYELPLVLY